MQDIFGDECPSKATIYRWIERFDNGDEEVHDDPPFRSSDFLKTRSNIESVQTILDKDKRITLRELEERVGISKATLHSIITEDLEMLKYEAWKLRELKRVKRCREEVERLDREREDIERIHSMDDRERKKEFEKNPRFIPNKQCDDKQYKFLQKYYHRGAFFLVNRIFCYSI
ncbi:hypothetical protein LOD99_12403 [Oopsacas minuta]|uniref:Micro-fibrillar-associated protein 1 C-terminal domain-containing protein n=1 Tax=Oopsacas minuta TaxID=111878 RepID=A0AAV7JF32_9METZ|nr:hypothetical protein LOD99_12403 [Oopsacas minuta]